MRLLPWWPYLVVLAAGVFILWPIPAGIMPMSQDHPVHMGRAWIYYETLKSGHLTGWSPHWYFGFPIGELYPPMGDLLMAAVRTLSFGKLPWASCYAFIFASAFISCGLILVRVARILGLSRLVGALAGVLILWDPGSLREGGWRYTVYYGVWLQPFATALLWWALAGLARAVDHGNATQLSLRKLIGPGCLMGLALLTHPIVLPLIVAASTFFAAIVGIRSRLGFARTLVATATTALIGLCIAAWWVLPLVAHRHWMGSYGVLHSNLGNMVIELLTGRWTRNMPHAVGVAVLVGVIYGYLRGNRTVKFGLSFGLCLWFMSQSDFFWMFRLDWLSEGFRHLQYQRFLTSAKPIFFLAAGLCATAIAGMYRRYMTPTPHPSGKHRPRYGRAMGVAVFAGLLGAAILVGQGYSMQQHHVGTLQVTRFRERDREKDPKRAAEFDRDVARFAKWAAARRQTSDEFYRLAFRARRHDHSFTDVIAYTQTPSYKLGFTPGETFIHKPESGREELLRRLRVRYYIARKGKRRNEVEVARFGELKVWERDILTQVAEVEGEGEVTVFEENYRDERIRVRLDGADPDTRLVFNIAGYPRWVLTKDGEAIEWIEVPVYGQGPVATQEERRAGKFRGGRPVGSTGIEPTLLAVDNATDGVYELTYQHWVPADKAGFAALVFAGLLGLLAAFRRTEQLASRGLEIAARLLHPVVIAVACTVIAGGLIYKYVQGIRSEAHTTVGWSLRGNVQDVDDFHAGPIKIKRLTGPAIILGKEGATQGLAEITFPNVRIPAPDPSLLEQKPVDVDDNLDADTADTEGLWGSPVGATGSSYSDPFRAPELVFPSGAPHPPSTRAGQPGDDDRHRTTENAGEDDEDSKLLGKPGRGGDAAASPEDDGDESPNKDEAASPEDDGDEKSNDDGADNGEKSNDDEGENETAENDEDEAVANPETDLVDTFEPIWSSRIIHGWFGVQDDALRRTRRGRFDFVFEVAVRPVKTQDWTVVLKRTVVRAYGKRPLEIPIPEELAEETDAIDLRVRLYDDDDSETVFGFDLELGEPAD